MFRHLMVPVDDTQVSAVNVKSAVKLASALGARVTFFHATLDFSATDEGALLKLIAPTLYASAADDDVKILLASAAKEAQALGVHHAGASTVSDHPADAIVQEARRLGCDLIVMASRGIKGGMHWLHTSQTEQVLQQSEIPVLITRCAASKPVITDDQNTQFMLDAH